MKQERCEICNELTGRAGRLDDSIICEECSRIICEDCVIYEPNGVHTVCTECRARIKAEIECGGSRLHSAQ